MFCLTHKAVYPVIQKEKAERKKRSQNEWRHRGEGTDEADIEIAEK